MDHIAEIKQFISKIINNKLNKLWIAHLHDNCFAFSDLFLLFYLSFVAPSWHSLAKTRLITIAQTLINRIYLLRDILRHSRCWLYTMDILFIILWRTPWKVRMNCLYKLFIQSISHKICVLINHQYLNAEFSLRNWQIFNYGIEYNYMR